MTPRRGRQPLATESSEPARGDIWLVSLGASRPGHTGKTRPATIVSTEDLLTGSDQDLIVVVPLSSSARTSPLRPVITPDQRLEETSVAVCGAVRAVSRGRLVNRIGRADREALAGIERSLALILGIDW